VDHPPWDAERFPAENTVGKYRELFSRRWRSWRRRKGRTSPRSFAAEIFGYEKEAL
jgi:hypothetical protein|tara:strand:- start:2658 stop:2825 length:168 start_codon:yes stop_codon:yes gene_type:complete